MENPAEHSKGFADVIDSSFHLRSSGNEANMFPKFVSSYNGNHSALCCQASGASSCFSSGNIVFTMMNGKLAVFKTFCLIGKRFSVSGKSAVFRI